MRQRDREEDLRRELAAHLECEEEELRARGAGEEEARYGARRALGNAALIEEEAREVWNWTRVEAMAKEFGYAWRGLKKSPGFAVTAVMTLALAIGAATAVFTVADRVLLRPLAFAGSERLVTVWEHVGGMGGDAVGPNQRHVAEWMKGVRVFTGKAGLRHETASVAVGAGGARPVGAVLCEPALLRVLGVKPEMGRDFHELEGKGAPGGAVLTYEGWQALFGGERGVVGRIVRIDDVPREVVGVLPAGFHFPNQNKLRAFRPDQQKSGALAPWVFLPVHFELEEIGWNGDYGNWVMVGRLAEGVSREEAAAQLNGAEARMVAEMGGKLSGSKGLRVSVRPMQETVVGQSRKGIVLLMGAVGALLLLAALNLANAQLGRALVRQQEAVLRAALGAARWRLLWSAVAENLLLGVMGGALGVGLAYAGLELFRRSAPIDLPRMDEVRLDWRVLAFSLAVTLGAGLVAGLAPGLKLAAGAAGLSGRRLTAGRASQRWRGALIGLEVCGSTVLVLVAALLGESLLGLLRTERGFEGGRTSIAEVRLTPKHFREAEKRQALIAGVLDDLRAAPGVERAGYVTAMPLEGESWIESVERADKRGREQVLVNERWVSEGYFEAMGHRLRAGRFFEARDRGMKTVLLSEGTARALYGSEEAVGREVVTRGEKVMVVGVVADARSTSLKDEPARIVYLNFATWAPMQTYFVAQSRQRAEEVLGAMRDVIGRRANVTVTRVKTVERQVADSLQKERFETLVLGVFGGAAVALAMLGIYGMLSYAVAARRQEIGVRMALGATRGRVYRMTMGQAGWPVALGLVGGLGLGVGAGRFVEGMVYGARGVGLSVMGLVALVTLGSAVVAAYVPARRAATIEPMEALRAE